MSQSKERMSESRLKQLLRQKQEIERGYEAEALAFVYQTVKEFMQ